MDAPNSYRDGRSTVTDPTRALSPLCVDLGNIDEPLVVCGGAYGNLEALQALFAAAQSHGVPPQRIIHTGDVVAYCADPVATADLLRASGAIAIQGNVEASLAGDQADCGCGFEPRSTCASLAKHWFAYVDARIGPELRKWMAGLPRQLTFSLAGTPVRVVHGGVSETSLFLFPSSPAASFSAEFERAQAQVVIAGHCGLPFTRVFEWGVWHNSGSLGLPANDGTARVWYSLIAPTSAGIVFEHRALDYDYRSARAKMLAVGLPRGYADTLETGLWPSLSILPDEEKTAAGRTLAPRSVVLPKAGARPDCGKRASGG